MDIEVTNLQAVPQQQLNGDISSIDGNDVTVISQSVSDYVSTSGDDKRKAVEAEQVSASEDNERQASSDGIPNQVSARENDESKGSSCGRDKTTVDISESISNMSSRPQRCLRLNRRGFYISKLNEKLSSKTTASINLKSASASASNIQRKWENFHKKPENESQIKETSPGSKKSEQSIVTVPRNKTVYTKPKIQRNVFIRNKDVTVNIENSTSQEPPKKKHKPITWP
ncbi:hypothetical protein X975_04740, partial [Stegodyphus mimosarum]